MGDLAFEHTNEVLALRDTQYAAHATQPLDSTSILAAEMKRVRDLDVTHTPLDTNTELERAWDGAR